MTERLLHLSTIILIPQREDHLIIITDSNIRHQDYSLTVPKYFIVRDSEKPDRSNSELDNAQPVTKGDTHVSHTGAPVFFTDTERRRKYN